MKDIKTLSDINTDTPEGRLAFAALARLTCTVDSDKTPDECIELVQKSMEGVFDEVEEAVTETNTTGVSFNQFVE